MTRYSPIYGTVTDLTPLMTSASDSSCSLLISMASESIGQVDLVVTPQTYVLDQHTFMVGDSITAIYDTKAPVPLIYPPRFTAVVLLEDDDGFEVMLDYFDQDLLNQDQTLKLSLSDQDETEIVLSNGQAYFFSPGEPLSSCSLYVHHPKHPGHHHTSENRRLLLSRGKALTPPSNPWAREALQQGKHLAFGFPSARCFLFTQTTSRANMLARSFGGRRDNKRNPRSVFRLFLSGKIALFFKPLFDPVQISSRIRRHRMVMAASGQGF